MFAGLLFTAQSDAAKAATSRVAQPRQTKVDAGAVLRNAVAREYKVAQSGIFLAAPSRPAAQIRAMMVARVHPAIAAGAIGYTEQHYRFTPADGMDRHVGFFPPHYGTTKAATVAFTRLAGQRLFRAGKILTPMTSERIERGVVVVFSDSGGDPRMNVLLNATAQSLTRP